VAARLVARRLMRGGELHRLGAANTLMDPRQVLAGGNPAPSTMCGCSLHSPCSAAQRPTSRKAGVWGNRGHDAPHIPNEWLSAMRAEGYTQLVATSREPGRANHDRHECMP
jgi:hypothetical protein